MKLGYDEWKAEQNQASGQGQGDNVGGSKKRGRPKKNEKAENVVNIVTNREPSFNKNSKELVIERVIPTYRYGEIAKYNTSMSAGLLGELYENGKLIYNPNVQRGMKQKKSGELIDFHVPKKVSQIYDKAISNELHGSTIVLNLRTDKEHKIDYNEEDLTLTIEGDIEILDGNHRLRTFRRMYDKYTKGKLVENPYDYEIPVTIEILSEMEAASCFAEYSDTPLKINKTKSTFLNVKDLNNMVIRKVMRDSELRGKVEVDKTTAKNDKIVTFSILSKSVEKYIKVQTIEQTNSVAEHLSKYINALVNTFPDMMGSIPASEREEKRKEYLTIEPMFFEAYMSMFNDLITNENMPEKLGKLKSRIKINEWEGEFLSRSNPLWTQNIMVNNKIINRRGTIKFVVDNVRSFVLEDKLAVPFEVI